MIRNPHLERWLLTLLCVALLLARVGGAHVHLCYDGNEPAASFHLLDDANTPHHDNLSMVSTERDVNVGIGSELSPKTAFDSAFLFAFVAISFMLLDLKRQRFKPAFDLRVAGSTPDSLRPPMRGPPLISLKTS